MKYFSWFWGSQFLLTISLVSYGLFSIPSEEPYLNIPDKILHFLAFVVLSLTLYNSFKNIFLLFILILIPFFDYQVKGAKRWIQIFNFTLQPSEIIKPIFVILTAWCINKSIEDKKFYLPILFIFFFFLLALILLQPDLGMTVLVSATFFASYL